MQPLTLSTVGAVLLSVAVICGGCNRDQKQVQTTEETTPNESTVESFSRQTPRQTTSSKIAETALSESADWPLFRGDSRSQGVARSQLPEKLTVKWKHSVKQGLFEGTPIIIGGAQKTVYIGDADGTLFAFDLESGDVRWTFKSEIGYTTAAAYAAGKIYIGDLDGKFYCLNAADGKKRWEFTANDSIDSSANFHKELVLFGSRDSALYALNAESGDLVWKLETGDQIQCSITVVGGRAFVAGCDGSLHVVDVIQGEEVASVAIESPTGVTPAAMGNQIFVGTEQAGVFAIDWKAAQVQWTFNDLQGTISSRSSPAVTTGHVIFGARNRKVYSVHPDSGQENWSVELKANIDSSPVIAGDKVVVGSTEGRLYLLELETGQKVWQKQLNGGIVGSPAIAYQRLVIATDEGVVYCLGSSD